MGDFDRFGPKFICNKTCCTIRPTPKCKVSNEFCNLAYPLTFGVPPCLDNSNFGIFDGCNNRLFDQRYLPLPPVAPAYCESDRWGVEIGFVFQERLFDSCSRFSQKQYPKCHSAHRYRLFSQSFGGYGGCCGNRCIYAVQDEKICDGLFITLDPDCIVTDNDFPETDEPQDKHETHECDCLAQKQKPCHPDNRFRPRRGNWYRKNNRFELCSGDLIWIPGEDCPFRVHLYCDDY